MVAQWFAVSTQPKQEIIARENLDAQEFETFLPLVTRKTMRWSPSSHRKKPAVVQEALYPSYLFARFDRSKSAWWEINSTRGVRKLISFGDGRPKPIAEGAIEWLVSQSKAGGFEEMAGYIRRSFNPGALLTIKEGPYEGRKIECIEDAIDTIRAFLPCFGGQIAITVPVEIVEAA